MLDVLQQLSDNWFLSEPAFFALYCQQQLQENAGMECPVRCGQGRIEYNPLLLKHKNYAEVEQLMRIELIRLFLKHPYERQPEGCSREAMSIGSNITIADGYCLLHKEKLPLHDPTFYHLPLGQYYEWYAKAIQETLSDSASLSDSRSKEGRPQDTDGGMGPRQNANNTNRPNDDSQTSDADNPPPDAGKQEKTDLSGLWREDSLERQKINELIDRTTDWGTLPADIVERIKASTQARIQNRLIWQGFHSAILSSQRHLTRMRPNRRTGFLQMGSTRQFDTRLLVAIDVSGSITNEALADFYSSVNRLFRYGVIQIDVCQFDAALGPITPMKRARQEVTVQGRGGTNYQPLFDYLLSHPSVYDGLLILTDGQAPPPQLTAPQNSKLPPILWVCQDRASYEASHDWMQQSGRCCHL